MEGTPGMKRAPRPEATEGASRRPPAAPPESRGWRPVYRSGEVNRCPGCGRSNWWVRSMAECAFCTTALPIASSGRLQDEEVTV